METSKKTAAPLRKRRVGQKPSAKEKKEIQERFLAEMERMANITAACEAAGISRYSIYEWQEHDETFGMRFREANLKATDVLFSEGWKRAVEGEEEYVVSQGKLVYDTDGNPLKKRVKSDMLLALYLKARMPEFNPKQQLDVTTHLNTMAEQAKQELLNSLETIKAHGEKQ